MQVEIRLAFNFFLSLFHKNSAKVKPKNRKGQMVKIIKTKKTCIPKIQLRQCLSFVKKRVWYLNVTRFPPPTSGLEGFSHFGFQKRSIYDPPIRSGQIIHLNTSSLSNIFALLLLL